MASTVPPSTLHATILVVDDEQSMRDLLSIGLARAGHTVTCTGSGAEAIRMFSEHPTRFDIVVTDMTMPGTNGMEVLRHACALPSPPLVIMITAFATTDTAIAAMKAGAYDYLTKPFKLDEIVMVVERGLERLALKSENRRLREELRGVHSLDRMVGRSAAMHKVFELIRRVAPTRTTVLIRGESGTGKELVARALHQLSDRASAPFVALNCGAIPENLMESELFGHLRGSFTGATSDREGLFAAAGEGTLFLDEIGELTNQTQVKLLRALQDRTVRPVGGKSEIPIKCRVVAATHRDLEAAISAGEFRSDLYFRLNVVQVVLPPLRHRREDIPILLERSFERFNREMARGLVGIDARTLDWFLNYDFPGNIRELENLVERAVALETESTLRPDHLPAKSSGPVPGLSGSSPFPEDGVDLEQAVADLERNLIEGALSRTGGVRKEAAKLLRVSFRSLRYRLEKLGIAVGPGGGSDVSDRAGDAQ